MNEKDQVMVCVWRGSGGGRKRQWPVQWHAGEKEPTRSASNDTAGTEEVIKGKAGGVGRGYFLESLGEHAKKLGFY